LVYSDRVRFIFADSYYHRIRVMDVLGRVVRVLGGRGEVIWDKRDDRGEMVSKGVYFIRVESKGCFVTKKFVLVR